ncbi:MAG: dephospho-CoA kinase [Planctomycetes bacterium]|nr:dephospho-CoA kinase [Planctomycetota bacterium]NOG55544.1 dephospho-CoA kinase [Planctomycetota bacterium]
MSDGTPQSTHPIHDEANGIPIIGLCGGIGSGKSEVARVLEQLGCVVTYSDRDVQRALDTEEVRDTLRAWWGDRALDPQGHVNRPAVAEIVFADEAARRKLEQLLHPIADAMRKEQWQQARRTCGDSGIPAFVIDAPLLFEAGLNHACDVVLFVDVSRTIRLERLKRDRGWAPEQLELREKSQWPLDKKRNRSDHVIQNNADVTALRHDVEALFQQILHDYQHQSRPDSQ